MAILFEDNDIFFTCDRLGNSKPPLALKVAVRNVCMTNEIKVFIPNTNAKQSLGMFFAISALQKDVTTLLPILKVYPTTEVNTYYAIDTAK